VRRAARPAAARGVISQVHRMAAARIPAAAPLARQHGASAGLSHFDLARRLVPLSPPNSGLPEFGKHGAQVGQARPAWRGRGEGLSELQLKVRVALTRLASLATLSPAGRGKAAASPPPGLRYVRTRADSALAG